MYTVLVADDERPVLEWLTTSVDWAAYGLRLVSSAENGEEAYEKTVSNRPDIVVIDVKMPGMSGLEVIEKVRQTLPNTEFVILSGYSTFEYVERAMRFGVRRYLLKPLDEEDLAEVITSIADDLHEREKRSWALKALETGWDQPVPFAKQQLILDWITDHTRDREDWKYFSHVMGIESHQVQIIAMEVPAGCIIAVLASVRELARRLFNSTQLLVNALTRNRLLFVTEPLDNADMQRKVAEITNKASLLLNCQVRLIATKPESIANLPELYRGINQRFALFGNSAKEDMSQSKIGNDVCQITEITKLHDVTGECPLTSFADFCNRNLALQARVKSTLVKKMLQAVMDNVSNTELGISWLAKHVVYGNPDYLSRTFRRHTGIRFCRYLMRTRIELAKEIFAISKDKSIAQVAQDVGFADHAHYFSRVFRRVTGISPTIYRNQLEREESTRGERVKA